LRYITNNYDHFVVDHLHSLVIEIATLNTFHQNSTYNNDSDEPAVMDKLSPELLSLIFGELFSRSYRLSPRPGIYASVCRKWQSIIEAYTFADIKLTFSGEDLSTFVTLFRDVHRQCRLRTLTLDFVMPAGSNSRAGHVVDSRAPGTALASLFNFLSTWETKERGVKVVFTISHASYAPFQHFHMLDQLETVLATVRCVSSLQMTDGEGTAFHPTATCKVVSALPNLQSFDYSFYDPQPKHVQLRKGIREALGTSLDFLHLVMLERLCLRGGVLQARNHSLFCGDLRDEDGVDPLNSAIRRLSQRSPIKRLEIEGLVSGELFTGDNPESTWSTLRQFQITGSIIAPDGRWYYTGDPTTREPSATSDYGSDADSEERRSSDSDISWRYEWREKPDWQMLTPILVAMARAVLRMPNLQRGSLLVGSKGHGVCVQCAAPGFRYVDAEEKEPANSRRCRIYVAEGYDDCFFLPLSQVPGEVRSAWREWLGEGGEMEAGFYWK
jgi:hypothetical protein